MDYKIIELWNPGILLGKLPDNIFGELKRNCLNNFATEKANDILVGNIKEEYIYPYEKHPEFKQFLLRTYDVWREIFFGSSQLMQNVYPCIENVWVNMQKKNEYNPNHYHTGEVSFVIWVQIPYELSDELKTDYYTRKDTLRKAAFQFTYSTMSLGLANHTMWINKHDEGSIIMFPSNMMHCVYPFTTTDEYRISVAGNLSTMTRNVAAQ